MEQHEWTFEFYERPGGRRPAETFINSLPAKEHVKVDRRIGELLKYGVNIGRPYVENLGDDIYELRIRALHSQYRVLFFIYARRTYVLLDAIKKNQGPVPPAAKSRAIEYKDDYLARHSQGEHR